MVTAPLKANSLKWLLLVALAAGCGGTESSVEGVELQGVDEQLGVSESALTGCLTYKSTLKVTATSLNLRTGPATSYSIVAVMPQNSTVITWDNPSCDSGGWYKVYWGGVVGWASGSYLTVVTQTASVRNEAITRAEGATMGASGGTGFSYWWGHGRWKPEGVTSATKGSCSGSCPDCSHSGSYGADCSGYVAKIWQVPSSNSSLTTDSHPYSTANFNQDGSLWSTVSRGSVKPADALVYNSNGAGHIILYTGGDGWNQMYAYECKGCSAGCVYGLRTASSSYHAIRRAGW